MGNYKIFKGKKKSFRKRKRFYRIKGQRIERQKRKNKREIEELFQKQIIVSKNDMDKFEEQETKKIRPIIRKQFVRFINKNVMGEETKIITDKLKDQIINDIWAFFETKKRRKKEKEAK